MPIKEPLIGRFSGEFIDEALERDFRDASFDDSNRRVRTAYWLIIVATFVVLIIAWQRFQMSADFIEVVTTRIFIGLLAIAFLIRSYRSRSWMVADNMAAFLYFCLLGLTVVWGAQVEFTPVALITRCLLIVFMGYLIRPTRMKYLFAIGVAMTTVMSYQVFALTGVTVPEITVAISVGIIVNICGHYVGCDIARNLRTNFTLRRQAQALAAEAQEAKGSAEKANQAKSEFLSSMSHELRTPLNAIFGFSQLLQKAPGQTLSEEQSYSIDQIGQAGRHLLTLINKVLDLSKIEEGHLGLSIEDVDLRTLLAECSALASGQAADAGISIELEPQSDFRALADYTRLKQIILNLLSNAIKYNRPEGRVRISTRLTPNEMVSVSVNDTGPGIPKENLGDLFSPFDRLEFENSAVEGTGIGLAITKKLVEAMGGSIEVKSEVGKGSTFSVHLPTPVAVQK